MAILVQDERELGVCLVDIGAGTTDIAIFTQGAIRHTASLPIGGDQVTNDIAQGFRTPTAHAEEIKVRYACALAQLAHAEETIQVPSVGDRPPRRLARQTLAEWVQPRYEELFGMVQAELRRSGYESLVAAGIVLTGGGAKMEGVIELAEEVFHLPVRVRPAATRDGSRRRGQQSDPCDRRHSRQASTAAGRKAHAARALRRTAASAACGTRSSTG